jgi:hypothetical protein
MLNTLKLSVASLAFILLAGCASVPMESTDKDRELKAFPAPAADQAGLYIYRDSFLGKLLKKSLYLDGKLLAETANRTYIYTPLSPGKHTLETESEFGNNALILNAEAGKNHYVRQRLRIGVFVAGASLVEVSDIEGRNAVLASQLLRLQTPAPAK